MNSYQPVKVHGPGAVERFAAFIFTTMVVPKTYFGLEDADHERIGAMVLNNDHLHRAVAEKIHMLMTDEEVAVLLQPLVNEFRRYGP